MERQIDYIVVHCSATYARMNWGAAEIEDVHVNQNGWSHIGYHYVIKRDGEIQQPLGINTPGIHARGFNRNSIAVCWIGGLADNNEPEDNRTHDQKLSLMDTLEVLKSYYPDAQVVGHCDLPGVTKACPCFNVKKEFNYL